MLTDPKHWDHILPFMQPRDVPHRIALTDADIRAMHAAYGHEDGDVPVDSMMLLLHAHRLPLINCSLQGSCPLLLLLPFRGEGARIVRYQIDVAV